MHFPGVEASGDLHWYSSSKHSSGGVGVVEVEVGGVGPSWKLFSLKKLVNKFKFTIFF